MDENIINFEFSNAKHCYHYTESAVIVNMFIKNNLDFTGNFLTVVWENNLCYNKMAKRKPGDAEWKMFERGCHGKRKICSLCIYVYIRK